MLRNLRFALRSLIKTPGFTLVAVLTMAVAIGACTSLFSVLQAVVLRPLAYPDPDSLVSVWLINPERKVETPAISWPKYLHYKERGDVFRELAVSGNSTFTITEGTGDPEQVTGLHVSANFLPTLGLRLAQGRNFTAQEDSEGGAHVAIISHRLWRTRFGSDPRILGRAVQIDGTAREIVGILPESVPPPYQQMDVIVPRPLELPYLNPAQRNTAITHQAIGRLAPGVTLAQAQLRVAEMQAQFKAANPTLLDAQSGNQLRTLTQQVMGSLGRTFWTLAGAVAAVLLIACANIANLFLARISARQREIAVRLSLGARRTAIIRQFLAESLVFSLVAGALGTMLAWWSLWSIQALAGPQLPRADQIALDPGVLAFSLLTALLSAVAIGLYPAWQASRTDVNLALKDATRGAGGGIAAKTFRHVLVVAQVALSLTLLICAALLVHSFKNLQTTELGFAVERRVVGTVNLPSSRYATAEATREFYSRLQEKLRTAPELEHGAAVAGAPLAGNAFFTLYAVHGRPLPPVQERAIANLRPVTPDYFDTLGIRLHAGRGFADTDRFGSEPVAVINEALATKLFPGESALDRALIIGGAPDAPPVRIVGVIKNAKSSGLSVPPPDEIYSPREQRGGASMHVVASTKPGLAAAAAIPVLRRLLAEVDPNLALANPQTMEDLAGQSVGVQRLTMALLLTFAAIAALLAVVGIYSIMAYGVTQRTGEIGVRMALGASPDQILALILRGGALQVGVGLGLGLVGAFGASRLLQQVLYEVKPFDPVVFAAVAAFFAVVAAFACLIPALRATRIDPIEALRAE